jgi:hypothetical protein
MELAIQRQGVEYLFGAGGLPTTLAQCESKLMKANGFNTTNGRYRASRARFFRNPRVLGNILGRQMEDSTQQESIYHVLRRFICNPANQAQLFSECNVPASTAQTTPPFQLQTEPRYASLIQDLDSYWLPADLVDLYFDWPSFTNASFDFVCGIRYQMSQQTKTCPINDIDTDFFEYAL